MCPQSLRVKFEMKSNLDGGHPYSVSHLRFVPLYLTGPVTLTRQPSVKEGTVLKTVPPKNKRKVWCVYRTGGESSEVLRNPTGCTRALRDSDVWSLRVL